MNLLDHIKWDDLYTQVGASVTFVVIGWFTGLFRTIAKWLSGLSRRGLKISRDTTVDGWYSRNDDIESVIGHPTFLIPVFIKTRWWITNYFRDPVVVAHAYFMSEKLSSRGKNRHDCQGIGEISKTGELSRAGPFEKIQHVELDAMLFTDSLDQQLTVTGYFVIVDQTGRKYRTETLRHSRGSAKVVWHPWLRWRMRRQE